MTRVMRTPHDDKGQPAATKGRLVTIWLYDDQHDLNKRCPIPAEDVDWEYPGDPVLYYRVEPRDS